MKQNKTLKIVSWILVAVCMAVIFALSAQSGSQSEETSYYIKIFFGLEISIDLLRTVAHCIEFAGLALLVFNAFYHTCGGFRPFLSFAISVFYAVSDEVHQLFVEGRAFQLTDIFIDSIGAAAGVVCALIIGKIILGIKKGRSA